ncbi:choice-of-anchor M domain-containing protein [Dermabacteraceae bacterium CCM 9519]
MSSRSLPRPLAALAALLLVWATAVPGFAAPEDDGQKGSDDPTLQQTVSDNEQYVKGVKTVLDHGHADLGPRLRDGDFHLQVRDDSKAPPVWRDLEDVVFQVHDAAALQLPEGDSYDFTGAKSGETVYAVPQVEQPGVVWLGWSTQDPPMTKAVDRGITMRMLDVQGPGKFSVFLQPGNFAPPQLLWSDEGNDHRDLWVDLNTHTHANWVFTKPGIYLVAVEVTAQGINGQKYVSTQTLRFAVGDGTNTDDAFSATWEPGRGPAEAGEAQGKDAAQKDAGKQGGSEKQPAQGKADGAHKPAQAGKSTTGEDANMVSLSTVALVSGASVLVLAALGVLAYRSHRRTKAIEAQIWEDEK